MPLGVEGNCTVTVKLQGPQKLPADSLRGLLLLRYIEDYINGPTAWIRSGFESDCEVATKNHSRLVESACIVYDRPDYPRVKGASTPVNGPSGERTIANPWSSGCCQFPVCGSVLGSW